MNRTSPTNSRTGRYKLEGGWNVDSEQRSMQGKIRLNRDDTNRKISE